MNLAVFKNGGVPSLHVMLGDSYSDPDDAFLGRFYAKWMTRFGGENNSGRPLVTGSDITVKGIEGHRPADAIAATNAARMLSRDETLAAFGVPRACVGLTENMTFGSVKAEKDSFRENSVNSYLMYKAQVVTEKVIRPTPGCSNGIFFWDDRTSGDAEQRLRELEADLELGVRSVNEVRTADRGLEAYPLGGRNPSIRGEEKFWVEAEPRPEPEPVVELSEFELEPDGPSTIEPGVEPVLTSLGGSTGAGGGFLTRAEMLAKAIRSVSLNGHVHGRS